MDDIIQFAAGLAVGLVIGRISRGMVLKKEGSLKRFVDKWAILIIAFMFAGASGWFLFEQQKCNENFARNLALRSKWAAEDRRAQNEFWFKVYREPDNRKENLKAFNHWVETFKKNDRKRAKVDLPNLADCD